MAHIDYLIRKKGGASSATPLNVYRRDALRLALVRRLNGMIAGFDKEKVPSFMAFAKKMLNRVAHGEAVAQYHRQALAQEHSSGYASLDAELEDEGENAVTLHDRVPDAASEDRMFFASRRRRFYLVLEMMDQAESRLLREMVNCNLVKLAVARRLGIGRNGINGRLAVAYAHFRAIWRRAD